MDFPGSPVVKNLPCNAGDGRLISDQENKTLHAWKQLRKHIATTELKCYN